MYGVNVARKVFLSRSLYKWSLVLLVFQAARDLLIKQVIFLSASSDFRQGTKWKRDGAEGTWTKTKFLSGSFPHHDFDSREKVMRMSLSLSLQWLHFAAPEGICCWCSVTERDTRNSLSRLETNKPTWSNVMKRRRNGLPRGYKKWPTLLPQKTDQISRNLSRLKCPERFSPV